MKWREATWKPFEKWHTINKWRIPWNKWKKLEECFIWEPDRDEKIQRMRDASRKNASWIYAKVTKPWHRTKIEKIIEELISSFWIKFLSQYEIMWITTADIYIPDKRLVIYADWDYWHNYPHWNKRDHYITKELKNCWFKVLRFWERDILNNINTIAKTIKESIT